jgi:anti-sigma B factor antagonist
MRRDRGVTAVTTTLNEMPAPSVIRPGYGADRPVRGRPGIDLRSRATETGTAIVTVGGELDIATADHLFEYVRTVMDLPCPDVILDLSDLTFCDCRGISSLIRLDRHATASGGTLNLSGLPPVVATLLRVGGLDGRFSVVERPAEADSTLMACGNVSGGGHPGLPADMAARPAVAG